MSTRVCQVLSRARLIATRRTAQSIVVVTALLSWLVLTAQNDAEQPAVGGGHTSIAVGSPAELLRSEPGDPDTTRESLRAAPTTLRISKVDSGWAVALPKAIATGSADPQQQTILHHVLEQGRAPLISRPRGAISSEQQAESTEQGATSDTSSDPSNERDEVVGSPLRISVRPDGVEGWRSPGPIFVPLDEPWRPPTVGPPAEAPAARIANSESGTRDFAEEDGAEVQLSTPDAEEKSFTELLGDVTSDTDAEPVSDGPSDWPDDEAGEPAEELEQGNSAEVAPSPSAEAPPPLTPQLVQLRSRVRSVLKGYYRRPLNSSQHDPWEAMHGMLSYGIHSRIRQGGPRGEPITAIGWLCYNKPCKGQMLLHVNHKGELRARYGVGLQGHLGQFLAMLAQCRVAPDYPIRVGRHEFTIYDLIEAEKKTCYPKSELTFKLIALQHYLDLNEQWVNDQGQEWDIPRLIREELAQPIRGAACGGTHRLSGLSLTVKARLRRGEPLDGEYARAAEFVEKYHRYAFRLQNRDGSLSTLWFRGRGDDSDINRRIKTTGHILEWLCYSLSDEELRSEPTVRAVSYLANLMYSKYNNDWEVGPMCHAIHALLLYDERVFEPFDGESYDVAYRPLPEPATVTYPRSVQR